jgi:Holliday junction resolvase
VTALPDVEEDEKNLFSPIPTVVKGTNFESLIKQDFEREGYLTLRLSGSRPFDLVALQGSVVLLIEVKSRGSVPSEQFEKQYSVAKKYNYIYVTVTRDKQKRIIKTYYYPDGSSKKVLV